MIKTWHGHPQVELVSKRGLCLFHVIVFLSQILLCSITECSVYAMWMTVIMETWVSEWWIPYWKLSILRARIPWEASNNYSLCLRCIPVPQAWSGEISNTTILMYYDPVCWACYILMPVFISGSGIFLLLVFSCGLFRAMSVMLPSFFLLSLKLQ